MGTSTYRLLRATRPCLQRAARPHLQRAPNPRLQRTQGPLPLMLNWGLRSWVRASGFLLSVPRPPPDLGGGANCASTARGGGRSPALMTRLSHNYYAYWGMISPRPLQRDECGSCAPTWPLLHRYGWCCYLATFCPVTITPISPCQSVSWSVPSRHR